MVGNGEGEGQATEPVAIVGMACKFPGAADLDAFWRLLVEGRNTVTEGNPGSGERLADLFNDPDGQNDACTSGRSWMGLNYSMPPSFAFPR